MADQSPNPDQKEPQEPAPAAGSSTSAWWGWGTSFVSTAVQSVSKASEKIVSDISTFIDPDVDDVSEPSSPAPRGGEPSPDSTPKGPHVFTPDSTAAESAEPVSPSPSKAKSEGSEGGEIKEDSHGRENPAQTEEPEQGEIGFSEVFDKGVSVLSNSANYLGGFLSRGIETVQKTEITELAMNLANTGYEKSKQTLVTGVKAAETFADRGLDALEKMGEKAMDFIALDTSSPDTPAKSKKKIRNSPEQPPGTASGTEGAAEAAPSPTPSASGETPQKSHSKTRKRPVVRPPLNLPTFETLFEEKLGTTSYQALENISIESMMKTQQSYRKMEAKRRELLDGKFLKILETFKDDKTPVDASIIFKWDERTEGQLATLNKAQTQMKDRLATLKAHFSKTLTELKENMSIDADESEDISGLIFSYLEKLQLEAANQIAELASIIAELLLCAAESLQGKGTASAEDSARVKQYPLDHKIQALRHLCLLSSEELSNLSTLAAEIARHLAASFKGVAADSDTQQAVDKDMSAADNFIIVTAGLALSKVTGAKKFFVNLAKHLTIIADLEANPLPVTPAKATATPAALQKSPSKEATPENKTL